MPEFGLIAEPRKDLGEVLTATSKEQQEMGINIHFETVAVEASDVAIEPMGYPVIYSTAADNFVPYVAQTISDADADGSPLAADARVALVVGDQRGLGFNREDVTLVAAGTDVTVAYRGLVGVLNSGIDWDSGTDAAAQAAFLTELEKQGMVIVPEAANVDVSYL